jgi:hypothetical protein
MKINYSQVEDLELEQNIVDSLNEIAELDYVKEISVSRDIHFCKDIPVGVMVKASRFNAKWIGSDIGCGVSMVELPKGFITLASTNSCRNASIADLNRNIYGVQFHPELKSTVESPAPLFVHFIHAAKDFSEKKSPGKTTQLQKEWT